MKPLFIILIVLLAGCAVSQNSAPQQLSSGGNAQPETVLPPPRASIASLAPAVSLAWNDEPGVASYQVYYGTSAHSYWARQSAGTNTLVAIAGLDLGRTYHFAVTAMDDAGTERDFSDELTGEPGERVLVRFGIPGEWQSSTNLTDWTPLAVIADNGARVVMINPAQRPNEFFRVVVTNQ